MRYCSLLVLLTRIPLNNSFQFASNRMCQTMRLNGQQVLYHVLLSFIWIYLFPLYAAGSVLERVYTKRNLGVLLEATLALKSLASHSLLLYMFWSWVMLCGLLSSLNILTVFRGSRMNLCESTEQRLVLRFSRCRSTQ